MKTEEFWLRIMGIIMFGFIILTGIIVYGYVNSPTNISFSINHTADENTKSMYDAISKVISYEKCLDKKLTEDMKEDIIQDFLNNVSECWIVSNYNETMRDSDGLITGIYSLQKRIGNCETYADWWSDNTTSITIVDE